MIDTNDYFIAIPSYNRSDTIKNTTLKLLEKYNICPRRVYIFVHLH